MTGAWDTGLGAFVEYLASAFGCERVVRLPGGREENLERSVVVVDQTAPDALGALRAGLERAPVGLLVRPAEPPIHAPADLRRLVVAGVGLEPMFVGWTRSRRLLAIVEGATPHVAQAPRKFRVVAVVPTYNEADVLEHTLRNLMEEGVGVYLLDNWSTDASPRIAARLGQRLGGLVSVERFPPEGPSPSYDLARIMARVEEVATELEADWVMLHDADERRRSPWPNVGLRDALFYVERRGYTCVDHVTLTFWPTPGCEWQPGGRDVEQVLRWFEFSGHPGHFHQRRAWKNTGQRVSLAASAGHDVQFAGRRVFPYRFLLKHYPIRSQAHGERKVLAERLPRWNASERAFGWHAQYDDLLPARPPHFVRQPSELTPFNPDTFYEDWLVERLSGVGVFREPPDWATPPVWHPLPSAA